MAAGIGLEYISVFTNDTLLAQGLHEGILKLIRDEVTTLAVNTLLECIANLIGHTVLGTGSVPESVLVGVGSTTGLGVNLCGYGLFSDGSGNGLGEFGIHSLKALHTADSLVVLLDALFHLVIGCNILVGKDAILVSVSLQECFGGFKSLGALIAHFDNSHYDFLLVIVS